MTTRIFVYGTLKPGNAAYLNFCQQWRPQCQRAIVHGTLYHLPIGYPALVLGSTGQVVHGYSLTFSKSDILMVLDQYEQHNPDEMAQYYPDVSLSEVAYQRTLVDTFGADHEVIVQAWSYTMTQVQAQLLQGQYIACGNWDQL
jgi:gamma-glutamylcyclotransferase (GGCT)/AIG2-like uncharacterized protein YtfP